jgi:anthranilate phosphoribosyltransferase
MKNVAATRKEIGVPTIFNLLGPMSNPARPARTVTGVHSPGIGQLMANALKLTGVKEAMVVCGAEKLDEVSYLYMKWYATILGILIFYVTNRSVLLARLM